MIKIPVKNSILFGINFKIINNFIMSVAAATTNVGSYGSVEGHRLPDIFEFRKVYLNYSHICSGIGFRASGIARPEFHHD